MVSARTPVDGDTVVPVNKGSELEDSELTLGIGGPVELNSFG